jgi:hypothetical protein
LAPYVLSEKIAQMISKIAQNVAQTFLSDLKHNFPAKSKIFQNIAKNKKNTKNGRNSRNSPNLVTL